MKNNKKNNNQEEESWGSFIRDVVVLFVIFVGIYYLIFSFLLSNEVVSGPSMQPTFEDGDRIISVRHAKIDHSDIVILKAPDEKNALYIKRVIGMPGDKIRFTSSGQLYRNGKKVKENYLTKGQKMYSQGQPYTTDFTTSKLLVVNHTITVPKGSYFVMGDHRNVSKDSRILGFISKKRIIGVVKVRYWPIADFKIYN